MWRPLLTIALIAGAACLGCSRCDVAGPRPVSNDAIGQYIDGAIDDFTWRHVFPLESSESLLPGSVSLAFPGGVVVVDDGAGSLLGPGVEAGVIDYVQGEARIEWSDPPEEGEVFGSWAVVG